MTILLLAVASSLFACSSIEARQGRSEKAFATRATAAIERGLAYLRRDRSDLSALVVLDYLQRKYSLPKDLAFDPTESAHAGDQRLATWGRFVGLRRSVDEASLGPLTGTPGTEQVVMHALYCDTYPLPYQYGAVLRQFADRGGYELTHAALALKIVRDNGCALGAAEEFELDGHLRRGMRSLISRSPADPRFEELDVRYEALAVLQDFEVEASISDRQFSRLLVEQQSDGGWKAEADHPSRPHPTVLAVWALLARLHPDSPAIPFSRGPRSPERSVQVGTATRFESTGAVAR